MKNLVLTTLFIGGLLAPAWAQVDIDKSINLSGTNPADAKISGIKQVSAAQDAVSVEALQSGRLVFASAVSGVDDISLTFSPAFTASSLVAGTIVSFKAAGTNTGNVRLNVSGLGLKPLYKDVTNNLAAGNILNGQMVSAVYDGTNFHIISRMADANSGGTVTSINTTAPITGGSITSSGTIGLTQTGDVLSGSGISVTGGADKLPGTADITIANTGVLSVAASGVLSSTGGQNPGISLSGIVPIANGGTGISSSPSSAGQYLRSSAAGTWAVNTIQPGDIPGGSGNYIQNGTSQQASANFNISGNGTFAGATPLSFQSIGSGTYNQTVLYHNAGPDGFYLDLARTTNSAGGTPIDFNINARGGGANFFKITGSNGNVGIGTTSPYNRLDVAGQIQVGARNAGNTTTANWGNALIFAGGTGMLSGYDSDNSDPLWMGRYNAASNASELRMIIGDDPGTAEDKLVIGAMSGSANFSQAGSWTPYMAVQMNGYVGIGTTAPSTSLDVNGGARIRSLGSGMVRSDGSGNLSIASAGDLAGSHTHTWSQVTNKPAAWLDGGNMIADLGNFNNSVPSGFYQAYAAANSPTATWYNLINVRHSNTGNDHGFQIAASYYDENIWTRTYQGGSGANNGSFTPWRKTINVPAGDESWRIVRGTEYNDNSTNYVLQGSGWTQAWLGTGRIQITFTTAFSSPPSITVSQVAASGNSTRDNCFVETYPTANSFIVKCGDSNGSASNRPFSFIAVGPR